MTAPRLRLAPSPSPTSRLRVLFLIDSLGPGGAERLMVDLLPRLRDLGVDPEVVAIQERHGNPIADELGTAGFPVETIGIERLRERGALARVLEVVATHAPDVVHTQLEFADILGTVAAHRLGIPSISTIHTLDRPRRWSREAARFRVMAWTLRRRADRIVAVSDSARTHVLRRAGLPRRRTITIHNGIDLDPFLAVGDADRSRARDALGLASEQPVVTTIAVLRELKGIQHMLEAMPVMTASHPDLVYLVAGDGPHRTELETIIDRLGLRDSVRLLGAREDVPEILAASDLFVLPSLTEALPTVIIEAMAAGVPVVATNVGGTPEVVGVGDTGVLVPPASPGRLAEAVVRLLDSPRHRSAMGQSGRRTAEARFSIDRQARRLLDEYRTLHENGTDR